MVIRRPAPLYAGLLVALGVTWAIPPGSLLTLSPVPRFLAALIIAFAPIILANMVFSQRFRIRFVVTQASGRVNFFYCLSTVH